MSGVSHRLRLPGGDGLMAAADAALYAAKTNGRGREAGYDELARLGGRVSL